MPYAALIRYARECRLAGDIVEAKYWLSRAMITRIASKIKD